MFFQRFGGRPEGRGYVDGFAYVKIDAEFSTRPVREGITFCSLRDGHSFDR